MRTVEISVSIRFARTEVILYLNHCFVVDQSPISGGSPNASSGQPPGKIDMKQFNKLSNAIGRLNLNSPLGPTRLNNMSFDGSDYGRNQVGIIETCEFVSFSFSPF